MTVVGLAQAKRFSVKLYAITKYGTSDPISASVPVAESHGRSVHRLGNVALPRSVDC